MEHSERSAELCGWAVVENGAEDGDVYAINWKRKLHPQLSDGWGIFCDVESLVSSYTHETISKNRCQRERCSAAILASLSAASQRSFER